MLGGIARTFQAVLALTGAACKVVQGEDPAKPLRPDPVLKLLKDLGLGKGSVDIGHEQKDKGSHSLTDQMQANHRAMRR